MNDFVIGMLTGVLATPLGLAFVWWLSRQDAVQDILEKLQKHDEKQTIKRLDKLSKEAAKIRLLKSSPVTFISLIINKLGFVILIVSYMVFVVLFISLLGVSENSPTVQLFALIIMSTIAILFISVILGNLGYYARVIRNYNINFPNRARKILNRSKISKHDAEAMLIERQLDIEYESDDTFSSSVLNSKSAQGGSARSSE